MTVKIIHRTNGGWNINILRVTIPDICPVCGGQRGEPKNHNFYEDGDWYSCDRWENPCGHIDKYSDVLKEAEQFGEKISDALRG
jgi:hypothetical protein